MKGNTHIWNIYKKFVFIKGLAKFKEPAVPSGLFSSKYLIFTPNFFPLEKYFLDLLEKSKIDYRINGSERIPGIINITFFEIKGQDLLMNLDMLNIAISYGSACSSGSANVPLALLEMGMLQH